MTLNNLANIAEHIARFQNVRGLRIAVYMSWWERLIEFFDLGERWEYLDKNGKWIKFWRRNGKIPHEALK